VQQKNIGREVAEKKSGIKITAEKSWKKNCSRKMMTRKS